VFSLPAHLIFAGWQLSTVFPYALQIAGGSSASFGQLLDARTGLIIGNGLFCLHALGLLVFFNMREVNGQFSERPRRASPEPLRVEEFPLLEPRFPDSSEQTEQGPWSGIGPG
jgi:hypothetical protein